VSVCECVVYLFKVYTLPVSFSLSVSLSLSLSVSLSLSPCQGRSLRPLRGRRPWTHTQHILQRGYILFRENTFYLARTHFDTLSRSNPQSFSRQAPLVWSALTAPLTVMPPSSRGRCSSCHSAASTRRPEFVCVCVCVCACVCDD
jgi:hypothetical protein